MLTRLHLFDQKYNKNCKTVKYDYDFTYYSLYVNIFQNVIYSCPGNADFSQ